MPPAAAPAFDKPRVLALEPDAVTSTLLELYLRPAGAEVQVVASVEAALEAAALHRPALALLDALSLREASDEARAALAARLEGVARHLLLMPDDPDADASALLAADGTLTRPLEAAPLLRALRDAVQAVPGAPVARDAEDMIEGFLNLIREMNLDESMAAELAGSFVERGRGYLDTLREALQNGDDDAMERAGHALKGMAGNLRFHTIVAEAEALREATRMRRTGDAATLVTRLEQTYQGLRRALGERWPVS